jgi:hypothetical protein
MKPDNKELHIRDPRMIDGLSWWYVEGEGIRVVVEMPNRSAKQMLIPWADIERDLEAVKKNKPYHK